MKCVGLKSIRSSNGTTTFTCYSLFVVFLFGVLSSVFVHKFWLYVPYGDQRSKHLIVRRPFSIVDFGDQEFTDTDHGTHELIIRETDVDVVCKYIRIRINPSPYKRI